MSSQQTDTPGQTPSFQRVRAMDKICDAFEAAWLVGEQPRIEDYFRDVGGELRARLFEELLLAELDLKQTNGISLDREEYVHRFPEFSQLIDGRLRQSGAHVATATSADRKTGPLETGSNIRIRCPHCHNHIEVVVDAPLDDLTCSSCGSHFSLVQDEKTTRAASKITTVGQFELIERLGLGGFGSVWKARDTQLERTVAVKIPRRGLLEPLEVEQFLREARTVAQLRHPNIVRVYEVGRDGETVYIVSDLVRGVPLADRLTSERLTAREAAQLCAKIADALHHAHEAGVVHRDLKPQNIMLDAEGEPHLMDFGLARREACETTMTIDGQVLGTPAYMSPEQAQGQAHQADRRSDIYSLGVMLFELLTGELPFRGNARMLIHHVIHDDAPSPRRLNSTVPRDLETICLKCLEKDPQKRYESAQALAVDLWRYTRSEPIHARPVSWLERSWRWCRRNRAVASLTTLACSLLLVLAIAGPMVAVRQATARKTAEDAREATRQLLYVSDTNAAAQAWDASNIFQTLRLLYRHRPAGQDDLRGVEWYYFWRLCHESLSGPSIKHPEPIAALAFAPGGRQVASASGNTIRLWNVGTRTLAQTFDPPHRGIVSCVAFSPNGEILASGSADKTVRLWDVDTGQLLHELGGHTRAVVSLSFARSEMSLASSDRDTVRLWDVSNASTGHPVHSREIPNSSRTLSVAISPDNARQMAMANVDGSMSLWDIATTKKLFSERRGAGHGTCVAFSPNGKTVASANNDSMVSLWDVGTRKLQAVLSGHSAQVLSVEFSPSGKTLATASMDGTVRVWDVTSRQILRTFKGHVGGVRIATFSPDGKTLASGGHDRTLRFWDVTVKSDNPTTLAGHSSVVFRLSLSPDARRLASHAYGDELRIWDLASGTSEEIRHDRPIRDVEFSPRRNLLALAGAEGVSILDLDVEPRSEIRTLPEANCVAFSPTGKIIAAGSDLEDRVTLWDTETWMELDAIDEYRGLGWAGKGLAFSADGRLLAIAGSQNTVALWVVGTQPTQPRPVRRLEGHSDRIVCLAFSYDSKSLATGSQDGTAILWDVATGKSYRLRGSHDEIWSLAFSPDDKTLATCSDNAVHLWNITTKEQVSRLNGHASKVSCVTFSPDGTTLISGSFDTTIKLWRAATEADVAAAGWMEDIELPQTSIRRITPFGIQ